VTLGRSGALLAGDVLEASPVAMPPDFQYGFAAGPRPADALLGHLGAATFRR
jgi:hypothetical protein